MIELLQYIFSSFWYFLGFTILFAIGCNYISSIFEAIFRK